MPRRSGPNLVAMANGVASRTLFAEEVLPYVAQIDRSRFRVTFFGAVALAYFQLLITLPIRLARNFGLSAAESRCHCPVASLPINK